MAHEKDYYEHARHWDEEPADRDFERRRLEESLALVPSEVRSILDVGAGNGLFLKLLEDKRECPSMMGIERATAVKRAARCRAPILSASAERLPFRDAAFELVSSLNMIEHLPYGIYERALTEIQRVSSRYILISVPYRQRRLKAVCPYCGCEFNPHYHMRSYDETSLSALFSGFHAAYWAKVYRAENLLQVLARPIRRRVFSRFLETTLCPQCGFKRSHNAEAGFASEAGRLGFGKSVIKSAAEKLPTLRVARNIVVLFEADKPQGKAPQSGLSA